MKKAIIILASLFLTTASFAIPAWDKPLHKIKFTDPYVDVYGAYVIGQFNSPNYACNVQVALDHSTHVKWLVTVQVFGLWDSELGGASYKSFDIVFNTGQWYKSINFPMSPSEQAYTSLVDVIYEGPF